MSALGCQVSSAVWDLDVRSSLHTRLEAPESGVQFGLQVHAPVNAFDLDVLLANYPRFTRWSQLLPVWRHLSDVSWIDASYSFPVSDVVFIDEGQSVFRDVARFLDAASVAILDAPVLLSDPVRSTRSRPNFVELGDAQLEALDRHFEQAAPPIGEKLAERRRILAQARDFFRSK
jgi:hypothetical protein